MKFTGWACAFFSLVLLGCSREPSADERARTEAQERSVREAAEARAATSAAKAEEEAQNAQAKRIQAKSFPLDRATRAKWVKQCIQRDKCSEAQVDAIIHGAPANDHDDASMAAAEATTEDLAGACKDGPICLGAVGTISGLVARPRYGMAFLSRFPTTTAREAKKDPASAKGKRMTFSGTISEIRKVKDITEGGLFADGVHVRFATSMSTDKIFDGSYATFKGVFVQEYVFENVARGETHALMLVGAFDIPDNR